MIEPINQRRKRVDISDKATQQEEMMLAKLVKHRKPEGPQPTGYCLHCGEMIQEPKRWCDADCRNEWEKRK
jgi:hypothetical protein